MTEIIDFKEKTGSAYMKMFRYQYVILYLCLLAPMAKGQGLSSDQVGQSAVSLSAGQIIVLWDSPTFTSNQTWVSSVLSKYQGKINHISLIQSNNRAVMVQFQAGKIREEDLLQVLEMEGVPAPYFTANGRKFFLGFDKTLVNEPLK